MPDKKPNVLSHFLCVFKAKKQPYEDIVTIADKIIEEYIYSKNKLIHRKCKKKNHSFLKFTLILGLSLAIGFVITKI